MSIESALRTRLAADATIAAAVGTAIHPTLAPQATSEPYIVYTRITGRREYALDAPSTLQRATYQIDVYATTASAAIDLGEAVVACLHSQNWTDPDDAQRYAAIVLNEQDLPDEEARLHRRTIEIALWL